MREITRELSEFVAGITYVALPPGVAEQTKTLVMDLVAIALRARNEAESTPALMAAVEKLGLTGAGANVIGDAAGYTPPGAALINGTLAHSLDFDDTHAAASIHPSAPIVPAALAAAEMTGADGRDLIAGIVAGYEVQIRLSLALVPKEHYLRGYHPTATCGAFGAAAAAARIFGLSAAGVAEAFGICLSQTAGSVQFAVNGAWTKRFQVGYAAMNGLIAASLAGEGFKGAAEAIEGKAGFLRSYAPEPRMERAVAGLGETYETLAIAVKPYPSCRYSHAAIDALLALRAANDIGPEEIDSVEIGLPRTGWNIIGDPEDYKRHPKSVVDDRAEAEFPARMSGVARIHTGRGRFEKFVATPKGEPENFPTPEELRAKFDGLVGPYLAPARVDALAQALLSLDLTEDLGALLRLSRPEPAGSFKMAAGEN